MTASLRRHHLARLKQKRRWDRRASGNLKFHLTTPKPCSCILCGNPRKFYGNGREGKTIQERSFDH
ncbi:MAG: hypothetical protein Q3966_09330 [Neisseria sp.]|nr:hypothetical protein [Neisseria sp.]